MALVLGASDGAEERRLAMGLATPDEIRRLQRKLYVKAKGDDTRSPGGGPVTCSQKSGLCLILPTNDSCRATGVTKPVIKEVEHC